jgi:hypothetical protein
MKAEKIETTFRFLLSKSDQSNPDQEIFTKRTMNTFITAEVVKATIERSMRCSMIIIISEFSLKYDPWIAKQMI